MDGSIAVRPPRQSRRRAILAFLVRNTLVFALILLFVIFGSANGYFLTPSNLINILLQCAGLAIVAVTSGLVIITGEIDLSVGSMQAFAAVLTGYLMVILGLDPILAILLGLFAGTLFGALSGLLATYGRINSLVVTLGMGNVIRGATYLITLSPVFGFPDTFLILGNAKVLWLPLPIWIAAVVFLLGWIFLTFTPTGRHLYGIGMNREAAYLAGLKVDRVRLILFAVNGFAASLTGIILASRLNSAPPGTLGVGFELQVLTAVLLGGIAFTGGRGGLTGVLVSVLFLGTLQAGLTAMNVGTAWQLIAQGVALICAVALDHANHRKGRRSVLPWGRWKTARETTDGIAATGDQQR